MRETGASRSFYLHVLVCLAAKYMQLINNVL